MDRQRSWNGHQYRGFERADGLGTGCSRSHQELLQRQDARVSAYVQRLIHLRTDGYQIVRHPQGQSTQTNLLYSISDAFQPLSTFDSMFPWPQYQGVALDPHIYTVFTNPEVALSMQERIQAYCGKAGTLKASKMWT